MSIKKHKQVASNIKTGNNDSILASLFRTILFDIGIDTGKFNILLERYMIRAGLPNNIRESSSVRGNLKKELLKNSISWKVFIKGLMFLNITKFELVIRLHHSNKIVTEHKKTVALDEDFVDE